MYLKNTRRGNTQKENNTVAYTNRHAELVCTSSRYDNHKPLKQVQGGGASGVPLHPSSSRNVGMRDIGVVPHLYCALQACTLTKRVARGFTLIELLVVVLIIGILAAVALPQYQFAVKKAQYTELLQFARAMQQAQQIYFLEHGSYSKNINELPISLAHIVNKYQGDFKIVYAGHDMDILPTSTAKGPGLRVYYPIDSTNLGNANVDNRPLAGRIACMASSNMHHKVCQKLGGLPAATGSNLYFLN